MERKMRSKETTTMSSSKENKELHEALDAIGGPYKEERVHEEGPLATLQQRHGEPLRQVIYTKYVKLTTFSSTYLKKYVVEICIRFKLNYV